MVSWDDFVSQGNKAKGVGEVTEELGELMDHCPLVGQFLARYLDPTGHPVKCGTLTVFWEGGRLKVCLTDHFRSLKGFVTLETCEDLLGRLERLLQGGKIEWKAEKRR